MSTRCIIAAPDKDHVWRGVYHHSDGYPTGMGVYLARILKELQGNVDTFKRLIIDEHPVGWSHLFPSTYSLQGKKLEEPGIPQCYCHCRGETDELIFWGDDPDTYADTDTEWFYLVTEDGIMVRKISGYPRSTLSDPITIEEAARLYYQLDDPKHSASDLADFQKSFDQEYTERQGWAFKLDLPEFIVKRKSFSSGKKVKHVKSTA